MHILFLSAPGGGLDTNVRVLAPALVQAGHRVSVVYIHFPNERCPDSTVTFDGLNVYHIAMSAWHYYVHRAILGIGSLSLVVRSLEHARALARQVVDIHSHQPIDLIETPETFITPRWISQVPYVIRLHSSAWMWRRMLGESTSWSDVIETWLEGIALRGAAGISSPCVFTADYIAQICHIDKPIEIIPYPIDTRQFVPRSERAKPPIILFVGRVEKRKGAEVLLEAMPRVRAKHPDCELVFAGRVSDELKDSFVDEDGQRFSKEGRSDREARCGPVRFLGVRPRDELIAWYQRAVLFVAPSLWDNSPNTIYEAMACGTPVIATRVGGIPELVDDGVTGLLVAPRDPVALADAIIALLDDATRRGQMGRRARDKAVERFKLEKILASTLRFYDRLLETRRLGSGVPR